MDRVRVQSTNVRSIGYDAATETLDIEFRSGGVYVYSGVPADTHERLMSAESVGRFIAQEIKGRFDFTRRTEDFFRLACPTMTVTATEHPVILGNRDRDRDPSGGGLEQ